MAQIGAFKRTKTDLLGRIRTLHSMHTLFCFRSTSRMQRTRRTEDGGAEFNLMWSRAPGCHEAT